MKCSYKSHRRKGEDLMGRVFSWQEIASSLVPQLRAFNDITAVMKDEIITNPNILSGLLFGSVLNGSHNCRSDLDFLVIYESEARDEVLGRLRGIKKIASQIAVPLALIAIDRQLAASTCHSIEPLFAKHLAGMAKRGGVVKDNPLRFLNISGISGRDHFRNYLQFKLRFFGKDLMDFDSWPSSKLFKYLQKMLEAPVHIARKVLELQGRIADDDSRAAVIKEYPRIFNANNCLPELFLELIDYDRVYNAVLMEQLAKPDEKKYQAAISGLQAVADKFYLFIRQVALSFES